ncbi:MAG: dihydrolipoyl dehydrogenase [Thermoprotei archaeon]
MKHYKLVIIGSGSALNIVDAFLQRNRGAKIAVIDKNEPGGICLTRGCIPSKIMVYPAEVIRVVEEARSLGVRFQLEKADYGYVMTRMRSLIDADIESIRRGLSESRDIDYYNQEAEFVAPYTLKVGEETIKGDMFFLTTGSKPYIPPIKGLDQIKYHTSDTVIRFQMKNLPKRLIIVGGGYIAAEFAHFFSAMGSDVTIIGRNAAFLPDEEPEVSQLVARRLGEHVKIYTGTEVTEVSRLPEKVIAVSAYDRVNHRTLRFEAEEILIAAGRAPENLSLHPEKTGVELSPDGWIRVDQYLQTTAPNIWAFGDADGNYMFRHVANYESEIVFYNVVLGQKIKVDYHAVPHAVFTYPEVASVGMKEQEAITAVGEDAVRIGFQRYQDTAKGEAMGVSDYFVKIILEEGSHRILGAHVVGPYASILIQEIINLMYTTEQAEALSEAMHIHPSLSEVIQRAYFNTMTVDEYHELFERP